MYEIKCRYFNGYKPCERNSKCDRSCSHRDVPQTSILLVHLGAMGAVLRSTALLPMIKRKYPSSYITWVTEEQSRPLLENNPWVDRVLGLSARDQLILAAMKFDVGFFIDKSPEVAGLQKLTKPARSYGFGIDPQNAAIVPLQGCAHELWEIGLDNQKKFYENRKTELQLIAESLELPYQRDEYLLQLSSSEEKLAKQRSQDWSEQGRYFLVGLNTGTSGTLEHKTIPIEFWRKLLSDCGAGLPLRFVLLGGPQDSDRNRKIADGFEVIQSPTHLGLRDGICSVAAVAMVISADSLGMHIAIALKKPVVAWFGPTCSHEIDLYGRGVKVESDYPCSPCWKKSCHVNPPCSRTIDDIRIQKEVLKIFHTCYFGPCALAAPASGLVSV